MDNYFPTLDGHTPTRLPAGASLTGTALVVADPSLFDAAPVSAVIWTYPTADYLDPDLEVVTVTAFSHNTLTVTRSVAGAAAAHPIGAYIMQVPTPVDLVEIAAAIGAPGLPSGGTVGQVLAKLGSDDVLASWVDAGTIAGDVDGPASAVDGNLAAFDGVTGKLLKDSGNKAADFEAAGAAATVQGNLNTHTGLTGASVHGLGTASTAATGDFDAAGAASAVQGNLNTHTGDTANPHAVTYTQAGADVAGAAAAVAGDLSTHEGLTGTAVHGLGTASTAASGDFTPVAHATAALTASGHGLAAADRIIGRLTAGAGAAEELTAAQARTVLGLATSDAVTFGKLTATGYLRFDDVTHGTFCGYQAGNVNAGNYNTYCGYQAGVATTSGTRNTAVGRGACQLGTTAGYNVAVGYYALYTNRGNDNVAIGDSALLANTTGIQNVAIGSAAMDANQTGSYNVALGVNALGGANTGTDNVALGVSALHSNTGGYYNMAIGSSALYANTTGYNLVAIGVNAGRYISGGATANTTSNNSVYIGSSAYPLANSGTNEVVIGAAAVGKGSYTTVIGNASTLATYFWGKLSLGNGTAPTYALDVFGTSAPLGRVKLQTTTASYAAMQVENDVDGHALVMMSGGSTMAGTMHGVNRADCAQIYSNLQNLTVGPYGAFSLTLGTNNTARLTISSAGAVTAAGSWGFTGAAIGFFGTAAAAKPTASGSRGGNAALTSLLTALAGLGLLTDSTTA